MDQAGVIKWQSNQVRSRKFSAVFRERSPGILNSGATWHFLRSQDGAIPTGRVSCKIVALIREPRGATQEVILPMQKLSKEARLGDELPSLMYNSLVSVPTLPTNGYTTIFKLSQEGIDVYHLSEVEIVPMGEPVLSGWRDLRNGLWRIPLTGSAGKQGRSAGVQKFTIESDQVNILYHIPSVEARGVTYVHACLGFPTKAAMFEAAMTGRLVSIPFATVTNSRKFYPETREMPKGHLDQQRQGVRSTKKGAAHHKQRANSPSPRG
ncbi:hypothetical protein ACHAWF_012706 [Thalassiosira exigua]